MSVLGVLLILSSAGIIGVCLYGWFQKEKGKGKGDGKLTKKDTRIALCTVALACVTFLFGIFICVVALLQIEMREQWIYLLILATIAILILQQVRDVKTSLERAITGISIFQIVLLLFVFLAFKMYWVLRFGFLPKYDPHLLYENREAIDINRPLWITGEPPISLYECQEDGACAIKSDPNNWQYNDQLKLIESIESIESIEEKTRLRVENLEPDRSPEIAWIFPEDTIDVRNGFLSEDVEEIFTDFQNGEFKERFVLDVTNSNTKWRKGRPVEIIGEYGDKWRVVNRGHEPIKLWIRQEGLSKIWQEDDGKFYGLLKGRRDFDYNTYSSVMMDDDGRNVFYGYVPILPTVRDQRWKVNKKVKVTARLDDMVQIMMNPPESTDTIAWIAKDKVRLD